MTFAVVTIDETFEFKEKSGPACLPFQHSFDTFDKNQVQFFTRSFLEFFINQVDIIKQVKAGGRIETFQEFNDDDLPTQLCVVGINKTAGQSTIEERRYQATVITMNSLVCSVISLSLLWFLQSVSGIVNNKFGACDFEQPILSGWKYPIYSPNYPANYPPGTKCRWKAKSDQPIQITCMIFSIPESPNCRDGYLSIETYSKPVQRFCGARMFSIVSEENEIDVRLISSPASEGGYFLCAVKQLNKVVVTKPVTNDCRCGWKNPTRIAHGNDTGVNEYPMMAEITTSVPRVQCGATIINDKQVITAAHCIHNNVPGDIGVLVGEHDLSIRDETKATKLFRARSFIIHELYNEKSLDYDIALINIDGTITFSQLVGPVCLPFKHNRKYFEGKTVEILGWGSLGSSDSASNILQKAEVKVISPEGCSEAYLNRIGPRQICTLDETRDSCSYDSGGPVLWRNPKTRRVVLVAIIDYGMVCSSGSPSVNVDVSYYVDWIVSKKPPEWQYCTSE
ncbi:hypothetical protein KQX54_003968 [Cotesia glomerata]|uniref:Venom serine protease 34 n=1 Tax=Cotesia glomerata TaxID=32391 RepID=A0AAV7J733_COTGL|nr:hypothetical protein KQX54_003968 [Cotesia glomerata]